MKEGGREYRVFVAHEEGESKLSGLKEGLNGPLVAQRGLLAWPEGNTIAVSREL